MKHVYPIHLGLGGIVDKGAGPCRTEAQTWPLCCSTALRAHTPCQRSGRGWGGRRCASVQRVHDGILVLYNEPGPMTSCVMWARPHDVMRDVGEAHDVTRRCETKHAERAGGRRRVTAVGSKVNGTHWSSNPLSLFGLQPPSVIRPTAVAGPLQPSVLLQSAGSVVAAHSCQRASVPQGSAICVDPPPPRTACAGRTATSLSDGTTTIHK